MFERSPDHLRFARTREANSNELLEDYVKLISRLSENGGIARQSELARVLGVTVASIQQGIRRLRKKALAELNEDGSLSLTVKGRELATYCWRRHELVVALLESLGLDHESALLDAEGIEHHVSEVMLDKVELYLQGRAS